MKSLSVPTVWEKITYMNHSLFKKKSGISMQSYDYEVFMYLEAVGMYVKGGLSWKQRSFLFW